LKVWFSNWAAEDFEETGLTKDLLKFVKTEFSKEELNAFSLILVKVRTAKSKMERKKKAGSWISGLSIIRSKPTMDINGFIQAKSEEIAATMVG
jgi:fatty acid/phospholipid biosynthesis enzyme